MRIFIRNNASDEPHPIDVRQGDCIAAVKVSTRNVYKTIIGTRKCGNTGEKERWGHERKVESFFNM